MWLEEATILARTKNSSFFVYKEFIVRIPIGECVKFSEVDYYTLRDGAEKTFNSSWKIDNNSYINDAVMELLIDYAKRGYKVGQLFKEKCGNVGSSGYQYQITPTCSVCGERKFVILPKTQILNLINSGGVYTCKNCAKQIKEKEKRQKQEEKARKELEQNIEKANNTEDFIAGYLNPDMFWNQNIKMRDRYASVSNAFVNWSVVEEHIKAMKYNDFLNTPYWKAVAYEVKRKRNFRCELCGSNNKLAVHHKTYENHGKEHISWVMKNDLIVLCDSCHKKFHDIVED